MLTCNSPSLSLSELKLVLTGIAAPSADLPD